MDIKIRKWKTSDIDNLVEYANNKNISDKLADAFPFPYSTEFGTKFIEKVSAENPTKIFAISLNDQAIGSIGIFPDEDIHRKNAAIAYWVAEPFWGKGVAPKAILLILKYAFETFDIERVYAKPFGNNQNSHKVLEKSDFELEATLKATIFKNDEFFDEMIYGFRRKNLNS